MSSTRSESSEVGLNIWWRKLDRGVMHAGVRLPAGDRESLVELFRFAPNKIGFTFAELKSQDNLPYLVKAHRAVAAIPFGPPTGYESDLPRALICDGKVMRPPRSDQPALILTEDGRLFMDSLHVKGLEVGFGTLRFPLRKVNAPLRPGEIVAYTDGFEGDPPKVSGLYIAIDGRKVSRVADHPVDAPRNGLLLVVDPGGGPLGPLSNIQEGDSVELSLCYGKSSERIRSALTGDFLLISGGKRIRQREINFALGRAAGEAYAGSMKGAAVLGIGRGFELLAAVFTAGTHAALIEQIGKVFLQHGCSDALVVVGAKGLSGLVHSKNLIPDPIECMLFLKN